MPVLLKGVSIFFFLGGGGGGDLRDWEIHV